VLAELNGLRERIVGKVPSPYWKSQAETQTLAVRAWLAFKEGREDEATPCGLWNLSRQSRWQFLLSRTGIKRKLQVENIPGLRDGSPT